MNKDSLIYTIIFSFLVTFLFVFFLALANIGTRDIVEENNQLASARAVLSALGIAYDPADRGDVFAKYNAVEENSSDNMIWYEATVGGETLYALRTNGPGLWGNIEVVIGFNRDVTRFVGLEIIDQNETPGLGGRITEDWFKNQFDGQAIPASVFTGGDIQLAPGGSGAADDMDDGQIDAITGATRTSESMRAIVSGAARDMKTIVGGL
jgi:Na+-transporting NADH:ubiquinone oxidoreductase subunit C